jgi:hypothetical protein
MKKVTVAPRSQCQKAGLARHNLLIGGSWLDQASVSAAKAEAAAAERWSANATAAFEEALATRSNEAWRPANAADDSAAWAAACVQMEEVLNTTSSHAASLGDVASQVEAAFAVQLDAGAALETFDEAQRARLAADAAATDALGRERAALWALGRARRIEFAAKNEERRLRYVAATCEAALPAAWPSQEQREWAFLGPSIAEVATGTSVADVATAEETTKQAASPADDQTRADEADPKAVRLEPPATGETHRGADDDGRGDTSGMPPRAADGPAPRGVKARELLERLERKEAEAAAEAKRGRSAAAATRVALPTWQDGSSVECYDPARGTWEEVSEMRQAHASAEPEPITWDQEDLAEAAAEASREEVPAHGASAAAQPPMLDAGCAGGALAPLPRASPRTSGWAKAAAAATTLPRAAWGKGRLALHNCLLDHSLEAALSEASVAEAQHEHAAAESASRSWAAAFEAACVERSKKRWSIEDAVSESAAWVRLCRQVKKGQEKKEAHAASLGAVALQVAAAFAAQLDAGAASETFDEAQSARLAADAAATDALGRERVALWALGRARRIELAAKNEERRLRCVAATWQAALQAAAPTEQESRLGLDILHDLYTAAAAA